jgi:predicted acyltransferase
MGKRTIIKKENSTIRLFLRLKEEKSIEFLLLNFLQVPLYLIIKHHDLRQFLFINDILLLLLLVRRAVAREERRKEEVYQLLLHILEELLMKY